MQIDHVVCAFCGCVCDDLRVTVEAGRVVKVQNACALGKAWLMSHSQPVDGPAATIRGEPAALEAALDRAAHILVEARYPLVYGLSSTTCEAQAQAIALAEAVGACIDCCTSVCHGPSGMALQAVGEPACTLGEIKNRADLLIFWGCNPAESHPRHFARYSATARGQYTEHGRKDRTIYMVDVRPTKSTRAADVFLQIAPGMDFELMWVIRAMLRDQQPADESLAAIGVTRAAVEQLVERLRTCRYGVLFVGQGLTQTHGKQMNSTAAFLLIRELNHFTKFAAIPMRGHGNVTGIDAVMAWQTGYPFAVSFGRGYPRFNPGEFTAVDLMARGEADAALIVAADPAANWPAVAGRRLGVIPTICIDTHPSVTSQVAEVAIMAASAGVSAAGTMYRMDNVPIHMCSFMPTALPSDEEVLRRLLGRVRELGHA